MTEPTGPRRPLVVIPARFSDSASAIRYRADVTASKVAQAVYDAGGEPVTIHPVAPNGRYGTELDDLVRSRIGFADAVLLPGGGDLAAHWSGQSTHATQYDVDEEQDAFDLALARVALVDRIPVLAICRGVQVVNVARGGDLVQDLAETVGADHRNVVHSIKLVDGSPLRELVRADSLEISCYHHQGIGALGTNLRVTAYAEDGTVEAVSLADHDGWYVGVQWHPEDTADSDAFQSRIFRSLVEAAMARSSA
jgi:putative glutamine amidotransferase